MILDQPKFLRRSKAALSKQKTYIKPDLMANPALTHRIGWIKPLMLTKPALTAILYIIARPNREINMSILIGREPELTMLNKLYQSKNAEFIAIYGRRRIGKTFLVNAFFHDKGVFFEVTGSKKSSRNEQLKNYHREFSKLFAMATYDAPPQDWGDAFHRLTESLAALKTKSKIIIFLDELPWLAGPRSGFLPALEYAWNRHLSRMHNVILVVCGSAASWMLTKIVNDKEGFYGRLSAKIPMYPFDLTVVEKYLQSRHIELTRKQIVEIYLAMGGVGKYLSFLSPGKSPAQLINEIYFTPNGQLFLEFYQLYKSLFDSAERHIEIVRALSKKRYGIYQKELLEMVGLKQSGRSSALLDELEASGFIMGIPMFGKDVKEKKYRLVDEFSYFYLKWVEPVHSEILRGSNINYWDKVYQSQSWLSWAGYAFETICIKHMMNIKRSLGIAAVNTVESHWAIDGTSQSQGAQVDLICDRADDCIHLFEIKFCNAEFVIDKAYADNLRNKKERFRQDTGTKKAIFITMITPYGVKENAYYNELVQHQLTLDDLFS